MILFNKTTNESRLALNFDKRLLFENSYKGLSYKHLSELLHDSSESNTKLNHLIQACSQSDNWFLIDCKEIAALKPQGKNPPNHIDKLPQITFKSGNKYTGQWKLNNRHGFGIQEFVGGSYYKGNWENNCAHGSGKFVRLDANGNNMAVEYIGEWKCNMAHGFGKYFDYLNKYSYIGRWIRDQQSGYGVEIYNGTKYQGEFSNGLKNGYGILTSKENKVIYGVWRKGILDCFGRIEYPMGKLYEGKIVHGMKSGYGRLIFNNHLYNGQFENDEKNGFGEYIWADGSSYVGYWKDGMTNGIGIYKLNDMTKIECQSYMGQIVASTLNKSSPETNSAQPLGNTTQTTRQITE